MPDLPKAIQTEACISSPVHVFSMRYSCSSLRSKREDFMSELGTIYMLHWNGRLGSGKARNQAWHYTGWYRSENRIEHHRNGTSDVAIVNAFLKAGFGFVIARTRSGTKEDERRIKNAGGARRYCPICIANPRAGVWGPLEGKLQVGPRIKRDNRGYPVLNEKGEIIRTKPNTTTGLMVVPVAEETQPENDTSTGA